MNPPKPTAVRLLQGNPGKRPLPESEPKLSALEYAPEPPAHLGDGIAREKWLELCRILVDAGVLTAGDLHNLEAFCMAYQMWRIAKDVVKAEGTKIETPHGYIRNPDLTVMNDSLKQMREFSSLIGLDPSSRTRLVVEKPQKKNAFAALAQAR